MKIWKLGIDFNEGIHFMYEWNNVDFKYDMKHLVPKAANNQSILECEYEFQGRVIQYKTCSITANLSSFSAVSLRHMIDKHTYDILSEHINDNIEFIPVKCGDEIYYLIYVMEVVDAYDYDKLERAIKIMYTNKGKKRKRISSVLKFAFIEESICNRDIFRPILDGYYHSDIFVSSKFKELVESNGLTGFKFIEVWDSEQTD